MRAASEDNPFSGGLRSDAAELVAETIGQSVNNTASLSKREPPISLHLIAVSGNYPVHRSCPSGIVVIKLFVAVRSDIVQ